MYNFFCPLFILYKFINFIFGNKGFRSTKYNYLMAYLSIQLKLNAKKYTKKNKLLCFILLHIYILKYIYMYINVYICIDDNSGDENPYKELIVNNASKVENTLSQMEQWSILSNVINVNNKDREYCFIY